MMAALLAVTGSVFADDRLYIGDFEIQPGETKTVDVLLDNPGAEYRDLQFDLYLPGGITVAQDEDGEYLVETGSRCTRRHTAAMNYRDGHYICVLNSTAKNPLTGNSGDILSLTLTAGEGIAEGDCKGYFRNVKLSKVDATGSTYEEFAFGITVKNPEQPVTITADNQTMVYGDDLPALTYRSEGAELDGTPALSTAATKTSPVGTYPIKVEAGTLTNTLVTYVEGTLTITKAPLTVGVEDATVTEGDAIPAFTLTYSGWRNGDTEASAFTLAPAATTAATAGSEAGTYDIVVSGGTARNYEISYKKGTLTVLKKEGPEPVNDLTALVGVSAEAWNAGGMVGWAGPAVTTRDGRETALAERYAEPATVTGTVMEQTVTGLENGLYRVTFFANAFYTDGRGFDSDITDGQMDVVFLFANGTRLYIPAHIGGEVATHGEYTLACNVTDGTLHLGMTAGKAGTNWHSIQIKSLDRTGDVEQPVTVTADNQTMVYGDDLPALTYKTEGAALDGMPALTTTAKKDSPAGTYPIAVAQGTVANTLVAYVEGTLTVKRAPLTVKAQSYTIRQGEALPAFEVDYSGFKNGETESVLTKKPVAAAAATSASEPGTYDITVSGAEAQNYEISYVKGTLTIEKKDEPEPEPEPGVTDAQYRAALAAIQYEKRYRIVTRSNGKAEGTKTYYLKADGHLTDTEQEAGTFTFHKTEGGDLFRSPGWKLDECFSNPHLSDGGATGELNPHGCIRTDKGNSRDSWEGQVWYRGDGGRYAVRSTNAVSDEWGASTYWTVLDTDNDGMPEADYSWTPDFVWMLQEAAIPDGIGGIQTTANDDADWYTLDGRKLKGRPAGKGVYIRNGKKVAVK